MKKTFAYFASLLTLLAALWGPAALIHADVVSSTTPITSASGGISAGATNTFSANQIFSDDVVLLFGTSSDAGIEYDTAQTPDGLMIGVGQDNRVVWVREQTDTADYARAQQTNPNICAHSAATTANQFLCLYHDQTNGVLEVGTGNFEVAASTRLGGGALYVNSSNLDVSIGSSGQLWWTDSSAANSGNQVGMQIARVKTLTESSATTVIEIPVAASAGTGGTLQYTIFSADATDQQVRHGVINFAITNKAATETCTLNNFTGVADASITETEDGNAASISAGTLTYAITCSTSPTNAVDIQVNAASSLTQTTLEARISVILNGPGVPTFP